MTPAESPRALAFKIADCFFLMFYGYQIYFFSKPRVRALFGDKGRFVF
jgi:hypothetical protein